MFCNYGEPLLNVNTPRFIRTAKRYLAQTMLATSLSVRRFDADAYIESGLDYMVLSIDGASQAVYERFRKKRSLELVCDNIRKLVAARQRSGKRTPVISWQFLAFRHNWQEIPPAAFEHEFEAPWSGASAERLSADPVSNVPATPGCHWLYKNIVMDANGRILPCCASPAPDKELVFSQFDDVDAGDLFNSERHKFARSFFAETHPSVNEITLSGPEPFCVKCNWESKTRPDINGQHIRQYFWAASPGLMSDETLELLSSW